MLELISTIIYLCNEARQKNKGMQMLEEARLKCNSKNERKVHYSLDLWCESWVEKGRPLLTRFEKREDGHWYRKEDV